MNELEIWELELVDLMETAQVDAIPEIEMELSVVRRAIGHAMSPQSQSQFVRASKRDLSHILNDSNEQI